MFTGREQANIMNISENKARNHKNGENIRLFCVQKQKQCTETETVYRNSLQKQKQFTETETVHRNRNSAQKQKQ